MITVQPLLNLLAMSLSDPARVAGHERAEDAAARLLARCVEPAVQHPNVQRGILNSILITGPARASTSSVPR